MHSFLVHLISLFFLILSSSHAALLPRQSNPLPPKQDPFYQPPDNLDSYQPGDIIRSRVTPGPIGAIDQYQSSNIAASYQLMYRTTSTVGDCAAAVTIVLIPHNADFSKVLAYQAAYDTADSNCSPSYTLQQKSNETSYDPIFMAAGLNQGWVVISPDYEGLNAAFVAGVGSGQALLDGVRAALQSRDLTGVSKDAEYALWGYSGGALASEWAIELQPLYAPELNFLGAVLGGLTPNATAVLLTLNGQYFSSLAFSGINGLMAAYSNLSDFVNEHLVPSKAAVFKSATTNCGNSSSPDLSFQNLTTYFDQGLDTLQYPIPQSVLKYGTQMGVRSIPTVPIHTYKAVNDEISLVNDTDALVEYYCSKGATIQYVRNGVGEHVSEAVTGSGGAFAYLRDRFNGVPVAKGCSTQNVEVSDLDPETVLAFGAELAGVLDLLLEQPLGPESYKGIL